MTPLLLLALVAQSGHWEGAIRREGGDALFSVDLDSTPDWRGSFEVPGSNAPPLPLADVAVEGAAVSFGVPELPGSPEFKGVLGEDGSSVRGTLTQGGRTVAFEMRRTGEPRVKPPAVNTPLDARFIGDWTGTAKLEAEIKLILHLRSDESAGSGTLDTADGRARNLALSAIVQHGADLAFDVRVIGGHFEGKLTQDAQIEGEWTQFGRRVPVHFARSGK